LSWNEGRSSVARSAVARVVRDDFLFQGGAFRALRAGRPEAPAAHNTHTLDLGGGAGEHSSPYSGCRQAALPPPIFSRTAGCFGVADELVHFGDVCALKGLVVGFALGWAVAPGIGATGVQDHEEPRA
jgi:hypothetical protein